MSTFLPHTPRLRPLLVAGDAVLLGTAAWAAHLVRFRGVLRGAKIEDLLAHPGLLVTCVLTLWALVAAAELYEPAVLRQRRELAIRTLVVAATWGGAAALATYLVPAWRFGRGLLMLTMIGWAVGGAAARVAVRGFLRGRLRSRALIVGDDAAVAKVRNELEHHPRAPYEAVDGSGLASEAIPAAVAREHVELVVVAGREAGNGASALDLANLHFSGVPVVVASELWAWLDGRLPVDEMSPDSFLHQPGFGAVHWQLFNRLTRVLDILLAALLLVVTAPIVALAALVVLVADGRPVFFLQVRAGQYGRGFRLVKLRTMKRNAEQGGPSFATEDDPRATAVGRVLRRLRIDELPQLINVLRGDMSLVGPRPERPEFIGQLARGIPYYTFRLAVPPGITGWAQVNYPSAVALEEHRRKLEFDLYFIRERSVGLYLLTLLRTVSAAIFGVRRRS